MLAYDYHLLRLDLFQKVFFAIGGALGINDCDMGDSSLQMTMEIRNSIETIIGDNATNILGFLCSSFIFFLHLFVTFFIIIAFFQIQALSVDAIFWEIRINLLII
jgi:hypothetical protein